MMWSKRLADIRPGTVISYAFLLLGLGYLRIGFSEIPALEFSFMGVNYALQNWVIWMFPVLVSFSSVAVNWLLAEVYQVLKRYSFMGFLWGLMQLTFVNFNILVLSTFGVILFMGITRLQRSKRLHSDYLDIGLLVGVYTLFDIRMLAILPLTWILLVAYGRLRWRAIFISIWGMVTVHLLVSTVLWSIGDWNLYTQLYEFEGFIYGLPDVDMQPWIVVSIFWWLFSLQNYIIALSRANIVKRQSLSAMLLLQLGTLILAGSGLWTNELAISVFVIAALTFIANDLQYRQKRWYKEVVFWSYICLYAAAFFL